MSPLHLLFCTSEAFFAGTLVSLGSTLDSAAPNFKLHIHIFDAGLSDESRRILEAFIAPRPNTFLVIHRPDLGRVEKLASKSSWEPPVFARLLAASEIHSDAVLSIDSDILVLRDVSFFSDRPFDGALLHAVPDPNINSLADDALHLPHLPPVDALTHPVFNCGFVWWNLALWRKIGAEEQCLIHALPHIHNLKYGDQSLLNSLYHAHWHPLDTSWNSVLWTPESPENNIHYLARPKPWDDPLRSPEVLLWWDYYALCVRSFLDITSSLSFYRARIIYARLRCTLITPLRLFIMVILCRLNLLRKCILRHLPREKIIMREVVDSYNKALQQQCAFLRFRASLLRRWRACRIKKDAIHNAGGP